MTKKRKPKIKGTKLSKKQLQKEILRLLGRHPKKQMNPRQIIQKLKVANNKDAVQHAMEQLVTKGDIVVTDNYKFQIGERAKTGASKETLIGKVDMTRTGAGYVVVDGREQDIFVAPKYMHSALNGDKVKIRYWTPRGRRKPEGEVLEVISRSAETFVGELNRFTKYGIVSVEGKSPLEIMVENDKLKEAKSGELVAVKIIQWTGGKYSNPIGEVTAALGEPGTSNIEMQAILINNGFDIAFPKEVIEESEALSEEITAEEIEKRRDFRETLTITIDPSDAKDFDDAISLDFLENGQMEIGVHIADVAHYIKPDTALDKEAYRRSTSVYLVDRVCPMLPERLSNGLCSLRPKEDKLTFSATFVFDENFKVISRWFGRGIIHSDRRFSYEEAQEVLETGEGDFASELKQLNKVAKKLRERKFKNGAIDFESEEVRFRLDEDGTPLEVYVKERKDAHMLVEDFMLLANREVAAFIGKKETAKNTKIPFVYRVHDEPDPERAFELAHFAKVLGFDMDVSSPESIAKSYNRLMKAAQNDPGLKMLTPLAIRTMAKAVYQTENIGHYGLGFSHYTHFTSPIRRYSDVLVHRILHLNLPEGEVHLVNGSKLDEQCKHISEQEKKAATAERESIKYKQVEFMEKHVGETFEGSINGLTDFGIFVELSESRCEGMIAYDNMDQAYDLGEGKLSIKGTRTGKVLKMGDAIKVKILGADLKRRRIELALVK